MAKRLIIVFLATFISLVACAPGSSTTTPVTVTPAANTPYSGVPRIPVNDAQDHWESGNAFVVDVRSRAEYEQAHVPGAAHIPVAEIETRFNELPRDVEIITYCT